MNGFRACGLAVSAVEAARKLAHALAENRLHRELKNFTRPKLLILDEVGYLTLDRLLHKATVVNVRGDFYRLRERRKAGATDPLLANPQPKDNRPAS